MQKIVGQQTLFGFGLKLKNFSTYYSRYPAFFSEEGKGDSAMLLFILSCHSREGDMFMLIQYIKRFTLDRKEIRKMSLLHSNRKTQR